MFASSVPTTSATPPSTAGMTDDVIRTLDGDLERQRAVNAAGFDRELALIELRGEVIEWIADRGLTEMAPLDFELFCNSDNPERRALVRALLNRIHQPERTSA